MALRPYKLSIVNSQLPILFLRLFLYIIDNLAHRFERLHGVKTEIELFLDCQCQKQHRQRGNAQILLQLRVHCYF